MQHLSSGWIIRMMIDWIYVVLHKLIELCHSEINKEYIFFQVLKALYIVMVEHIFLS